MLEECFSRVTLTLPHAAIWVPHGDVITAAFFPLLFSLFLKQTSCLIELFPKGICEHRRLRQSKSYFFLTLFRFYNVRQKESEI